MGNSEATALTGITVSFSNGGRQPLTSDCDRVYNKAGNVNQDTRVTGNFTERSTADNLSHRRLPLPFVNVVVVLQPEGVERVFSPCRGSSMAGRFGPAWGVQ